LILFCLAKVASLDNGPAKSTGRSDMDSLTGLVPGHAQEGQASEPQPGAGRRWSWPQLMLSLPLTVVMVLVLLILALPDILRPKARRWERFGDY
jgi:hypothetical protein